MHYRFECTLKGIRAVEETQRTRSFLYTSIAYAIASAYGLEHFNVYENGITSMNLHRREDLANSRASRTTHPKTMAKMAALFSLIEDSKISINLPYMFHTKGEVIRRLMSHSPKLLSSAVSCSRTFQTVGGATHCGYCFQCVDRRIAAYAVGAEKYDHRGLYTYDIVADSIEDREARTTVVDYIRQAMSFSLGSLDRFESEYLSDLAEIIDYVDFPGGDAEKVTALWDLFQNHGQQVHTALDKMRLLHEDVYRPLPRDSLLGLVSSREYLKPEVKRLAQRILEIVRTTIGDMFARHLPHDEPDLNEKLGALLRSHESELRSEHPTASFACASVVPDHVHKKTDLLIEAKYLRDSTSPSKATEGIASDLTKYPKNSFILFIVYDPQHRIRNDGVFTREIEDKGRNWVVIIR